MEPEIELAGEEFIPQATSTENAVDITEPQYVNLPQRVVEERAQKAHLGLGANSPGVDTIRAAIERGDEAYSRSSSANELQIKERDNRLNMLRQLASSKPAGAPITQDEVDLTTGLSIEPVVDPRTVWEKSYATFLTNRLVSNTDDPSGAINSGLTENPMGTFGSMDVARDLITKNERVNTRLSEMEARWKGMGFWDSALEIAETVIPGKSSLNISGRSISDILSLKAVADIAVPGNTLKEQVENLLAIPSPEVFAERLDTIVDRIAETNVIDAIDFLKAIKSYSVSDQFVRNIFGLADTADITGITTLLARGAFKAGVKIGGRVLTKAEAETVKAVDDTIKAAIGPQTPQVISGKIGATNESAALKVVARYQSENITDLPNANLTDRVRSITDMMPTFSKPGDIFDGTASLSNAQSARITTVLENNALKFLDTVSTTITPERLTPEALAHAIDNAKDDLRKQFQHINDSVLDVVRNPRDPLTNTDSVSVRLGKPSAETFSSSSEAQLYARDIYQLPDNSYTVGQQGTAFYLDVQKPLKETGEASDFMVTTNNQTPVPNMALAFVQGLRTPAEIFSHFQKANRDSALMGTVNMTNFLTEVAAPIGRLNKNQRRNLIRIMELNRDAIDEVGERGRYFETVQELETAYMDTFKRLPSANEVEAYYTAVQINEMDLLMRNFIAYRDLSRQGLEEFKVRIGYSGYSEYSAPKFLESGNFKARETDKIPWGNPDLLPVAVADESGTGVKVVYRSSPQADRDFVNDLIENQGYKIIQVARPQERVLKESAGINDPVQYIVTKSFTKEPLAYQQVGRNSGFHVEYADGFHLKQPRVSVIGGGNRAYEGDATLWSFSTRAQAKKFEERVNDLRKAIKDGVADLTPYITNKLPENEAWWRRQFDSEEGYFNLDQPFRVVSKGQSVRDIDTSIKELRDLTDDATTLTGDMDRKFQGERSQQLMSPVEGTEENPLIRLKPAPMIDPLSTTSRGIGQATRSKYFGDMKISVAEQWVREFADILDIPMSELVRSPMYYLHNPKWLRNVDDQARLAAAQATQKATMEFIGQQSPFGKQLQWLETKLADTVYNSLGQKGAQILTTPQQLIATRDPMAYFRGWAFRAKMGFFNVQQLFVQSQGLAHITAIAPQHATQSMAAYTFTRAMMLNDSPEIVAGAAQRLRMLGWKPEQFKESYDLMKRTGWQNIGREATFIDDMSDPKLYEGSIGKFLDKSAIFFTEAERMVRITAWHAAYREWRANNPNKTVANIDVGQILSRADTMTMNMTNASKSSWERGVLSIPAQFQSYGVRLFEQLWGGQLSNTEKARVIAMNSALYGIPVGVSSALAYPFYEDVRAWALEKGYTVSNGYINAMIEGIPSVIGSLFGADYNFAQRYGPGGINLIKDIKDADKTLAETLLGPAGSVYKDIFFNAVPAGFVAVAKALTGDEYEPAVTDLVDAARTITSVNAVDRVYMAMTIGKYISRKGTPLSETNTQEAIFSAITGLQPREFSDAMIQNQSIKDYEARKREIRTEINKHLSRALREASQGNTDTAEAYMRKVRANVILGDFTPSEITSIFQSTVGGKDKTLMDRIKRDWIMKAPASQRLDRLKRMENNLDG